MTFWENCWRKIIKPSPLFLSIFFIFFAMLIAGTLTLVILVPGQSLWHYVLYGFAGITTAYFVYTMVLLVPKIKNKIIALLNKNKFTRRLLSNFGYRAIIVGIVTFIFTALYVIFQGVLSIMSLSAWYGALTVYYLVLGIMRGNILLEKKKTLSKPKQEILTNQTKVFGSCGILLIVLTLAFSGVIVLTYKSNNHFEYAGLMIYVVATYTFLKLTISIVNLFKAKKTDDLYVKSLKNISFADALISIVALQVAMFQEFAPEINGSLANALTGGGVSLVIIAIGIYMIVVAHNRRKKI